MSNVSHRARGLTLVELVIAVAIMGAIGVAFLAVARDFFSLNRFLADSFEVQKEALGALKSIAPEVRSLSPSSLGAYPIALASSTAFTFYSDIDGDGLKERIRYFLDQGTLRRGVLEPSGSPLTYNQANEIVADAVRYVANTAATPVFSYYDASYDGTTAPLSMPPNVPSIQLLKVTLIIDEDSQALPAAVTLTTQVTMRNLLYGL